MPPVRQVRSYAAFLMSVLSEHERRYCLQLGAEHGLPMRQVRILAVETLLGQECQEEAEERQHDLEKISALDLLLLDPPEPVAAVIQANALARR